MYFITMLKRFVCMSVWMNLFCDCLHVVCVLVKSQGDIKSIIRVMIGKDQVPDG